MLSAVKDLALRDPDEIQKQIEALEKEVLPDTACEKKTYAANVIRLDIARLAADVQALALGMLEMEESINQLNAVQHLLVDIRRLESLEKKNLKPPSEEAPLD